MITIDDLPTDDEGALQAAAQLLVDGFREHWPAAWPDLEAALEEVHEALEPEKICRAACDAAGELVGWIGAMPEYNGNVWELHPLVVRADQRGRGVGRALVQDLEAQVTARGGLTIMLGTDDEDAMTSLSGVDLYPDVWPHIAGIRNLRGHPYGFYQRCGFVIVGVIPDANGIGKPDILMAKRVTR
jgi:aminoglycoside 6'-N-acetyltransferase I